MTSLSAGANAPLPDAPTYTVRAKYGAGHMDLIALLLDAGGKADGDDGVVLFSNPVAGGGSVKLTTDDSAGDQVTIDVRALPAKIERIVVATMTDTPRGSFGSTITTTVADVEFTCPETSAQAVQCVELYKRNNAWKVRALGDGYAEGMAKLLSVHGIEVADDPAPAPTPTPAAPPAAATPAISLSKQRVIDLTKKAEASGSGGVDLSKKIASAAVSLEKRGMLDERAAVILVLDVSYSAKPLFSNGAYQALCDRVFAAGLLFDDDGEIPTHLFATKSYEAAPVTLGNFAGWANSVEKKWGGTCYAPPLQAIAKTLRRGDRTPTFIAFITDGGNSDKGPTDRIIKELAGLPAFVQFIAVGEANSFPYLQKLDDLSGREVDNAGFFAVRDPKSISDNEFFELMMSEFPQWLQAARSKGIVG
ncbi:hypothetical protein DSM112329_05243 [Paraconexibacter sp. AEG42_29]|uniref:VWFA domain-containing protein n=1 Tax=Paraconexibacter sp. AEG42_29 TaxID=2997339 RepID=A0AAU7B380_9ACTN